MGKRKNLSTFCRVTQELSNDTNYNFMTKFGIFIVLRTILIFYESPEKWFEVQVSSNRAAARSVVFRVHATFCMAKVVLWLLGNIEIAAFAGIRPPVLNCTLLNQW